MRLNFPLESVGNLTFERPGGKESQEAMGSVEFDDAVLPVLSLKERPAEILASLPADCLEGLFVMCEEGVVEQLQRFPSLHRLILQADATDACLEVAGTMTGLTQLAFSGATVTAAGFAHVASLVELTYLLISCDEPLTDSLGLLAGLTKLEYLFLMSDSIDITQLPAIPSLLNMRAHGELAAMPTETFARHARLQQVALTPPDGTAKPSLKDTLPLRRALPNLTIDGVWHAPKMLAKLFPPAA